MAAYSSVKGLSDATDCEASLAVRAEGPGRWMVGGEIFFPKEGMEALVARVPLGRGVVRSGAVLSSGFSGDSTGGLGGSWADDSDALGPPDSFCRDGRLMRAWSESLGCCVSGFVVSATGLRRVRFRTLFA